MLWWYKRAKIAFNGLLRNLSSNITHDKNSIEESISVRAIHQYLHHTKGKFSAKRWFLIAKHKVHHSRCAGYVINWLKNSRSKFIVYLIGTQVHHFRSGGYVINWLKKPRNEYIASLIGTGIFITICLGSLETVPYTNRKHVVLRSKFMERKIGELVFELMKSSSEGKVLAEENPQSVRVRLIAKEIIESLQKGMIKDDTLKALSDESISRRSRSMQVQQCATGHLEGMNWEVVVFDEAKTVNACCLPGGKIIVYTGLLKIFQSDVEIATIIGHEVGHAVARHGMEQLALSLWISIVSSVLHQFLEQKVVNELTKIFISLPLSRRMELEADYIGLMLLASAGYDPRLAPEVYKKLGKVGKAKGKKSGEDDYLSTHPSSKKRVRSLEQDEVMKEALIIYEEFQADRRAKLDGWCEE